MDDQKVQSKTTKPILNKTKLAKPLEVKPLEAKPALGRKVTAVKPALAKPLKDNLLMAIVKVLHESKTELTDKIQKVVNKSIKKIVKKTDTQVRK